MANDEELDQKSHKNPAQKLVTDSLGSAENLVPKYVKIRYRNPKYLDPNVKVHHHHHKHKHEHLHFDEEGQDVENYDEEGQFDSLFDDLDFEHNQEDYDEDSDEDEF